MINLIFTTSDATLASVQLEHHGIQREGKSNHANVPLPHDQQQQVITPAGRVGQGEADCDTSTLLPGLTAAAL